jgi:hypothetical protein
MRQTVMSPMMALARVAPMSLEASDGARRVTGPLKSSLHFLSIHILCIPACTQLQPQDHLTIISASISVSSAVRIAPALPRCRPTMDPVYYLLLDRTMKRRRRHQRELEQVASNTIMNLVGPADNLYCHLTHYGSYQLYSSAYE